MIVEREERRTSFKPHYFDRPNFSRMIFVLRESFSFFGNYLKEDYQMFYKSTSLCHFFPLSFLCMNLFHIVFFFSPLLQPLLQWRRTRKKYSLPYTNEHKHCHRTITSASSRHNVCVEWQGNTPFLLVLCTSCEFQKQPIKYQDVIDVHVHLTLLMDTEQSGWLVRWNPPYRQCPRGVRTIVGEISASGSSGVPVCCWYFSACFIVLLWKGPKRCVVCAAIRSIHPNPWWKCARGWAQISGPSPRICSCRWTRIWTLWIRAPMLMGPSERAGRGRYTTGTPATWTAA